MIVRVNGRELTLEPAPAMELSGPEVATSTKRLRELAVAALDTLRKASANLGSLVFAATALPEDNLTQRLWPLIGRMQDFGLFIGIGFGLWGVYMIMVGNPEGKQKLIQALIGFIGLYIVPEAFMAIRDAFR